MGPREFLSLLDLTQLAWLAPDLHVVAIPTNRENQGGQMDATTNGTMGGGTKASPTNGDENGQVMDGVGGVRTGALPTTRVDRSNGVGWGRVGGGNPPTQN